MGMAPPCKPPSYSRRGDAVRRRLYTSAGRLSSLTRTPSPLLASRSPARRSIARRSSLHSVAVSSAPGAAEAAPAPGACACVCAQKAGTRQEQPRTLAEPGGLPASIKQTEAGGVRVPPRTWGAPFPHSPCVPPIACPAAGAGCATASAASCAGNTTSKRGGASGPARRMKGCVTPISSDPAQARMPRCC